MCACLFIFLVLAYVALVKFSTKAGVSITSSGVTLGMVILIPSVMSTGEFDGVAMSNH